jgi:thioredoxin reductase (NADPH)
MMNLNREVDFLIVGSGAAGCSAAIYLGMGGYKGVIVSGSLPGGLLTSTKEVDNYLGFQMIDGQVLANNMVDHAKKYAEIIYDSVISIDSKEKIVQTSLFSIKTKVIIIASGSFPKKLQLESEKRLENRGISYCAVCDGFLFKNKVVAVIGGGNSAFEETIYLSKICKKVYLIHRRNKFRGFKQLEEKVQNLVKEGKVEIILNEEVQEFVADQNECLSEIQLKNQKIQVQGAFVAIGYIPNSSFVNDIEKNEEYIVVNNKYETSEKGVYACGDVIYNNSYKQAIVAAASGCIAALEANHYLSLRGN